MRQPQTGMTGKKHTRSFKIGQFFCGQISCFFAAFLFENRVSLECVCTLLATKMKAMRRVLVSILAVDCSETPTGWEEKVCMFTSLKIWPFFLASSRSQSRFPQKVMNDFA